MVKKRTNSELSINKGNITIPTEVIQKWQSVVNILANIVNVPAALIMKVDPPYIEVFSSSESKNNPYKLGSKEHLAGLYCERVINTKDKLLVANALKDKDWDKNPDIKLGMISYLGFPIILPDGKVFGTICVLDSKENGYCKTYEELMLEFKELIESHLSLLYQSRKLETTITGLKQAEEALKEYSDKLEEMVEERTAELTKSYKQLRQEITQRKRAEKALRESEERYRTLFHHRGTVVVLIDQDGTISMVNKEIEQLTGYTEEEIIGKAFFEFDFFPGKEKKRILGYHQARRKGGNAPISYETKIRRKDREIRTVLVNVALIPGTKRSIASIMDITDRKKTEQELKRKSREIRSYARQMKMTYKALEMAYLEMIHALVISVETRDPYTRGHSERVTQYSKEIAKRMGLKEKELKNLELACRIHDIGKIGISDRILLKDDKLTIAEWAEMKMHPVRGAEMLTFSEFFKPVIPIVRHHHERWDGKGYPDGLKRKKIPLGARIMAVTDTFDAMSSSRPYRDAIDLKKIVEELKENAGTQLDPQIVETWLEIMEK